VFRVGQDVDYETVTLKGPSLSVAFLASLNEASLLVTRRDLYAVAQVNETELEDQLTAALRTIGTLVEEKPPAENKAGLLELRIGQWHLSVRDAAMRTLRLVAAQAAALVAAGMSGPTVAVAVISLVVALPDLLAANKLSVEELDAVLVLEAKGPCSTADLAAALNMPVARIQAILVRLVDKKVISGRQGTYAVRW
jgi:hypothetical protein